MQSIRRTAIILFVVFMIVTIDSTDAKSIAKRSTQIDYYDNIIEQLDELRKMPFFGEIIEPWISQVQIILEQSNRLSDKSISKVFNSLMPCNLSMQFITCQGTLDVENAKLLFKKILSYLVPNVVPQKYTPMVQFAAKMI